MINPALPLRDPFRELVAQNSIITKAASYEFAPKNFIQISPQFSDR